MKEIEIIMYTVQGLLLEAEEHSKDAAIGYDMGWYNGKADAYETVLDLLKKYIPTQR